MPGSDRLPAPKLGGILTGKSLSMIILGLEGSGKSLVAGNIIAALIQQDNLARVDIISESVSARSKKKDWDFMKHAATDGVVVNTMAEFPSDPGEALQKSDEIFCRHSDTKFSVVIIDDKSTELDNIKIGNETGYQYLTTKMTTRSAENQLILFLGHFFVADKRSSGFVPFRKKFCHIVVFPSMDTELQNIAVAYKHLDPGVKQCFKAMSWPSTGNAVVDGVQIAHPPLEHRFIYLNLNSQKVWYMFTWMFAHSRQRDNTQTPNSWRMRNGEQLLQVSRYAYPQLYH